MYLKGTPCFEGTDAVWVEAGQWLIMFMPQSIVLQKLSLFESSKTADLTLHAPPDPYGIKVKSIICVCIYKLKTLLTHP